MVGRDTNEFEPSDVQRDALHALERRLRELKPPADLLSPEEAGNALLSSGRPYDGGATNMMGSYDSARLSVPQMGSRPVDLLARLPEGARGLLVAFEDKLLLNDEEWGERCERQEVAPCYWDPKLRRDSASYMDLVRRMHDGGLLCYVPVAKARVGAFCVRKKNDRLRLVIDCRATNARFRPTPHLPMGTGAAWADVMLGEGAQAWVSQSDIKDYFYACALPAGLCPFFCMEPVAGSFVSSLGGAMSPNGQPLDGSQSLRLFPALKVLPMGWSWSFYFAHLLHTTEIERALKLPENCLLRDRVPAPTLEGNVVLALPYCDNLSVAATSAARADAAREACSAHSRASGFVVHEEEPAALWAASLIDGALGRFGPTAARVWRLRQALLLLATRPAITGIQLERVLGHATFVLLARRDLLAIFSSVYAFTRRHYRDRRKLWRSAASECRIAAALVLLADTDMRAPWHPDVFMTDASPAGFGVMQARLSPQEVAMTGQWDERWRFKLEYLPAEGPRSSALRRMDPFKDIATVMPCGRSSRYDWTASQTFPEVPLEVLRRERWREVVCGRWEREEAIHLLEGRACLVALRRALRCRGYRGHRLLGLTDNMSVCLAFSKGRACDNALLQLCRQRAALCLAGGVRMQWRWLASEANHADGPSRRHMQPSHFEREARIRRLREFKAGRAAHASEPNQRRRMRRRVAAALNEPTTTAPRLRRGDLSLVERRSVNPTTQVHYATIFDEFMAFCRQEALATSEVVDLDQAAVLYLDYRYLEGDLAHVSERLLAALLFHRPDVQGVGRYGLARTRRAIKGFTKSCPPRSRVPLPWEWAAGLAATLHYMDCRDEAIALLVSFDTYIRPGALMQLRVGDALRPLDRPGMYKWCIQMFPEERGQMSKTGTQDDTVILGCYDIDLAPLMKLITEGRSKDELLFPNGMAAYKTRFEEAAKPWDWAPSGW